MRQRNEPVDAAVNHRPDHEGTGRTRGRLIVLVGPSAVGKSTVVARVCAAVPDVYFSVSATTRDPRPGEVDGRDYHFVSAGDFDKMIAADELLLCIPLPGPESSIPVCVP